MPSRRWRGLQSQVSKLRSEFLPGAFHPLGLYARARSVQSQARAFVVFAHAEIEWYLEDWARAIAKAAEAKWVSNRKFTPPLVYMSSCLIDKLRAPRAVDSNAKDVSEKFADATVTLFQRYYRQINENHGIKGENVLGLFTPLGLPLAVLGSTLLQNLDAFGSTRGQHAHTSARAVVAILDPETEFKRVGQLVDELLPLDDWLVLCKGEIR